MRLHVHTQGDGDRTALLVHGAMSDHSTWHAVAGALVERGYTVLAPDLRGHGLSPRGRYLPEEVAADLAETLPAGADLAIGHSMGGLALSMAVDRLRPARAVYYDPGWQFAHIPKAAVEGMRTMVAEATADSVRAMNPRWSDADIEAELAGFGRFDQAFFDMIGSLDGADLIPAAPVVPSLVQLADPSFTVTDEGAARLRAAGFEVRVVKGTGHCSHRDDFDGYMATLEGWI
ncbi:alpha/beta fold hydrolase [Nocardiopsis composta]|uniref:Pimeloyl-ACP methyl ester carboxylesterase n=1 Tax=Nocardiopsis composta TaxID=157465 RepID=A0A7W8QQ77_9ACTN|nr:alpha/beta hydrolase [Nocardiopsis composta]MBB5434570.1 pimeloyl-ACP methyl ester carboxylesterase [Nocardiopsis composta]